jgi:hypothetical protein
MTDVCPSLWAAVARNDTQQLYVMDGSQEAYEGDEIAAYSQAIALDVWHEEAFFYCHGIATLAGIGSDQRIGRNQRGCYACIDGSGIMS